MEEIHKPEVLEKLLTVLVLQIGSELICNDLSQLLEKLSIGKILKIF